MVDRPIVRRRSTLDADFPQEADAPTPGGDVDPWALTFHYHIPLRLEAALEVGHWVNVPFRHEQLQAVVVALTDTAPIAETRPLLGLVDPQPVLTPAQIKLAYWLSREYLAPLANCIKLFLPPRAGPRIDRTVELLIPPAEINEALLDLGHESKQAEVLLYLASSDDPLPSMASVTEAVGCSQGPVRALADKGWVSLVPRRSLIGTPQTDLAAVSGIAVEETWLTALELLIRTGSPLPPDELLALVSGLTNEDLKKMGQKGLVTWFVEPVRVTAQLGPTQLVEAVVQLRGAQKQAEVLDLLAAEDGPVWVGWVYAQTRANLKTLRDLAAHDLLSLNEARRWRDPLAGRSFVLSSPPILTKDQQQIWQLLADDPRLKTRPLERNAGGPDLQPETSVKPSPLPYMLHGVTGSGKTEIYLQAIGRALQLGQGAIVLVPEIALAAQTVQRVAARFPGQVAVWHSALSAGERYDTWQRVRTGELPIVVGPRSALFSPLPQPGVIVVDEEHEPAYKQHDRSPTFHAREAAVMLGQLTGAVVILGSATPDVASYRRAQRGEYRLLSLPNRILAHKQHLAVQLAMARRVGRASPEIDGPPERGGGAKAEDSPASTAWSDEPDASSDTQDLPMPAVEIVDLREELKAGNRSIFSRVLAGGIRETLAAGEQVILFLNRRGAATFVICRDCGYVAQCPRCDTTLTYHTSGQHLACHYCGYRRQPLARCPKCGSERIRYFGLGTQRVEEALRRLFPKARPLRWDRDTTRKKGSHDLLFQHFSEGRANVLIGTQMVAKGLDLPLVTLVGVISADTSLYLPDYLAAERTFQLLMQIAGRAGRSPLGGRVIIQTYTPDQPAIQAASRHDYHTFYQSELRFRYEQRYPPFKRLARLLFVGQGQERSRKEAVAMFDRLQTWVARQGLPDVEVIGPAPGYVPRIGSRYRWQILIRGKDPAEALRRWALPLGWRVDIDPVSLL